MTEDLAEKSGRTYLIRLVGRRERGGRVARTDKAGNLVPASLAEDRSRFARKQCTHVD